MRWELGSLTEEIASWRPGADEWCVKECLGHIIETEAHGFAGRISRILEEPGRLETGWDPAQVQRDREDRRRSLAELLVAFAEMRAASVRLVEGLVKTDLQKSCVHEQVGELRIEDLLHEWVYHDRNHHRQMLEVVQDYVLPSMGNCRKFAGR